jgi:hypothetical protein
MLKLHNQHRDAITGYLSTLVVPVSVGVEISKIIAALSALEPLPEEDKPATNEGSTEGR